MSKKYDVYHRLVIDSFFEVKAGDWKFAGSTYAVSAKKAINNVKWRLGISDSYVYEYGCDTSGQYEWTAQEG